MLETKCQENARAIAQQIKSGGSGSDVTVTQVLSSGTKIATIAVGDVSTDLYCETMPTPETPISVTADGVKTMSALLDELYALIDATKLNEKSVFVMDAGTSINYYNYSGKSSLIRFTGITMSASTFYASQYDIKSTGSNWFSCTGSTVSDVSSTVVTSGTILSIIY